LAGIGFDLKKLFIEEKSSAPKIGTAIKSAFVTSGPWLSSVAFLGVTKFFIEDRMLEGEYLKFMSIMIYGFIFSMAISSSVSYMATRKLADILYLKRYDEVSRLFIESALVLSILSFAVSFTYIYLFTDIGEDWYLVSSFFTMMCILWLVMIFVSSMRDFDTVFYAFVGGLVISFVLLYGYGYRGYAEALFSFSVGVSVTIGVLFAILLKEFGFSEKSVDFSWLKEGKLYILFFNGFFFYAAMWADKVIYWFLSHFGVEISRGFFFFPAYDFAIFIAYLTMIPAIAYFTIFVETLFYEEQKSYLLSIENKKDLWHIKVGAKNMLRVFFKSILNIVIFQFSVALFFMLVVSPFLDMLGVFPESIPLLRIALFCALLQLVLQIVIIFMYYFDFQKEVLFITVFAFLLNAVLTYAFMDAKFSFVGYPYFISLLVSVVLALVIAYYKLSRINYYTFMNGEVV